MYQAPRKSSAPTRSYEETALVRAEQEQLAAVKDQLAQVRAWADSEGWKEGGSDGLFAILADDTVVP